MWIAGNLALLNNHKRLLTSGPVLGHWTLEPSDTQWLRRSRQHRLSDTGRVVDKDMRCVQGVKSALGDWSEATAADYHEK